MKATMVEFLNDDNSWVWWKIFRKKTPLQAVGEYLREHFEPEDIKGWKKDVEKSSCALYYSNEVRAYRIDIE